MATEEENPHLSPATSAGESKQQSDPEKAVDENAAKEEDAERNAHQGNLDNTKQENSPSEKKELGLARLLFIWIGIWFAVFLYSLVSFELALHGMDIYDIHTQTLSSKS